MTRSRTQNTTHRRWTRLRHDVMVAVVVLLVVAPLMQPLMAQQGSRYALTAALWDSQTVEVTDYEWFVTVDRAERDGRLYSDKAPGQPVLAIPAYASYRAVGGPPATAADPAADVGLWWVNFWSAALPAALLAVLMRRFATRVAPRAATPAALAMALSTMLLPFATQLFGHVLSALLGLGAYMLLAQSEGAQTATARGSRTSSAGSAQGRHAGSSQRPRPDSAEGPRPDSVEGPRADAPVPKLAAPTWRLAAAGFLAGVAVTVEFTMGLAVVVFGLVAVVQHRWRAVWYVAGGLPLVAALGMYNAVAFGSPFTFSYEFSEFAIHEEGFLGAQWPDPQMTWTVLFGERGLFLLTPVVLVAVVGCVMLLRGRHQPDLRRDALVALALLVVFVGLMGGWNNPTGGAAPGPRYVVPALPFLVLGIAWVLERAWPVVAAATAVGLATMGIATFTLPLAQQPHFEPVAMRYWLERAANGEWAPSLLTEFGNGNSWFLLPPLLAAGAAAAWLWGTEHSQLADESRHS